MKKLATLVFYHDFDYVDWWVEKEIKLMVITATKGLMFYTGKPFSRLDFAALNKGLAENDVVINYVQNLGNVAIEDYFDFGNGRDVKIKFKPWEIELEAEMFVTQISSGGYYPDYRFDLKVDGVLGHPDDINDYLRKHHLGVNSLKRELI